MVPWFAVVLFWSAVVPFGLSTASFAGTLAERREAGGGGGGGKIFGFNGDPLLCQRSWVQVQQ